MKNPKPTASSLRRNSGWVITSSRSTSDTIAPAMNAPRITSRPSASATAAKPTNSTSAPRTRICALVSCRRRRSSRRRRERVAPRSTSRRRPPAPTGSQQQQRRAGAALAREEDREQDDRPEVRDRRGGDDQLTERRGDLPGVLEHGHEHAERRRAQDDRHEQRRVDEPAGLSASETIRRSRTKRRTPSPVSRSTWPRSFRTRSPGRRGTARTPARSAPRPRPSGRPRPAEHRRPDDDPGHDLQHDRGQPQPREQAEQQRRANATAMTMSRFENEAWASRGEQSRAPERGAECAAPDHDRPPPDVHVPQGRRTAGRRGCP